MRTLKLKLIFKDKHRKLNIPRKTDPTGPDIEAKSSSKTSSWSEEEQEVSQYLNFEEQELPDFLKAQ